MNLNCDFEIYTNACEVKETLPFLFIWKFCDTFQEND